MFGREQLTPCTSCLLTSFTEIMMKSSEISTANTQKVRSEIGFNYVTIKITRSRIDKGLLAIPVSLLDRFPKEKRKITIFFDSEEKSSMKSFVPYNSSSQECRIHGLSS